MQLGLNTTLPSQNVTPNANNTLTVQQNGTYEIHYNVLLSTNKSVDIGIGIRQNGAILPNTRSSQTLAKDSSPGSSYNGQLSGTVYVPLQQNDILDLVIAVLHTLPPNLSAVTNANAHAILTIKKLDE